MKKAVIATVSVAMILSFMACKEKKQQTQTDAPITLVMAEVNPPETISGRMDSAFKEKVEELSGGKIKIDLQFSGILGDESQVLDLIKSPDGSIQLMRGPSNLEKIGGKKSLVISIPFTFNNDEHFWKFAHSEVAQEILNEPYENGLGVKGLFYAEEGFRHIFSVKESPIQTVEDIKGKKFRVSGSVLTALAKSLEAEGVKIAFNDLYAAFTTGDAEVAEQPIANYLANSFDKVAPNLTLDGHMLGAVQVMINSKTWDSLSENQREIIKKAGEYAQDYCKKILEEATTAAIEQVKANGGTVFEISDKTPWQEACAQMISESSKDYPELYKKILELGK